MIRWLPFLALILISLNLRPALTSIAPLIELIVNDTGLSRFYIGFITSLPVFLMGIMAAASPRIAARWGIETSISASLALLSLSLFIRIWADQPVILILTACGIGIGIAVSGTLMSAFIKLHFGQKLQNIIPIYTFSMTIGAAAGLVLTLPFLALFNDWRWAMAIWCVPAALAWLVTFTIKPHKLNISQTEAPKLPLTSIKAWVLTILFALQSGIFYSLTTWLVARYEESGSSLEQASEFAGVFMITGIGGAFIAPVLLRWISRTHLLMAAVNSTVCLSVFSIVFWPMQWPLFVCGILGLALTSMFALALTLPIKETKTPFEAASLTAMMLTFGFCFGSVAPALVGWIRDLSGSYELPFLGVAIASGSMVALSMYLGFLKSKSN